MSVTVDEIYNLLPAIYRARDAENGFLRQVIEILAGQISLMDEDIARLYDNWFIETADEWLVPYMGELLGVRNLHSVSAAGFTQRARVANTLRYRRRKGTATVLEQLARDTTLWAARAVEFFQLLGTTQYLNHPRPANHRTPDLRNVNRLQLIEGPFGSIAHTMEARRVSFGRGKYNIPNVGIFLWRLQSYGLQRGIARPAANPAGGRYFFSPLGQNMELYNLPASEETITLLAEESNVPAPIRPLAFLLDLQAYREQELPRPLDRRESGSVLFGPPDPNEPNTSLSIEVGDPPVALSPLDVICMDLSNWARPPVRIRAALSGDLSAFPAISAANPEVNVAIGDPAPRLAALVAVPANLDEARALLENAIQGADPSPAFRGASVVNTGERLLIIPGESGADITITATLGDATTAGELALDAAPMVDAAQSARLRPFPALTAGRMNLIIGADGPHLVTLPFTPRSLSEARQALEQGIRAAAAVASFQQARVMMLEDSLVILPGGAGGSLTFASIQTGSHNDDAATVYQLGLKGRVAVDVRHGRLAFALGENPTHVRVSYHYGFPGDLGGGPYDRAFLRRPNTPPPPAYANTVAEPFGLAQFLQVGESPAYNGLALYDTLTGALADWSPNSSAVIEIEDNRTYEEDLDLTLTGSDLVIQSANRKRAVLLGNVTVRGRGRLVLNGLLLSGQAIVADTDPVEDFDPLSVELVHCTLVPGLGLSEQGEALSPAAPSVTTGADADNLLVVLDHTICGPLHLPEGARGFSAADCILDSPLRGDGAQVLPVLVSGVLDDPPILSRIPRLNVTIGDVGPLPVSLPRIPQSLEEARSRLERELREAGSRGREDLPGFSGACVLLAENRLIILPGVPEPVLVENRPSGTSADDLKLSAGEARPVWGLVSGAQAVLPLQAVQPRLLARMGQTEATITLNPAPADLNALPASIQQALRGVGTGEDSFDLALVLPLELSPGDRRLLVLPGEAGTTAGFFAAASAVDVTTLADLSLSAPGFALAATLTGERPGPLTRLERVTVFGPVHVRRMDLVSEVILTHPVQVDHRQEGCVRFSFVPPGSRTPRRFRCQPDLALAAELSPQGDACILERLKPSFTSSRYGGAAYAQLRSSCPVEIRIGAEDGSEMGAWSFLKQPQREANLRASLDEYLRFGLEAGLFFVS